MNRRFALTLFLAASLLSWESAFACERLAGLAQSQCCCEEGFAPCPKVTGERPGCCAVIAAPPHQLADVSAQAMPTPDYGKDGQPPALPAPISIVAVASTGHVAAPPLPSRDTPWLQGSLTYLRTARLRL